MQVHTVKHGETLAEIAERYGFRSYEPIFVFNTEFHQNIPSKNRDLIMAGSTILIPRSYESYDQTIKELQGLSKAVVLDGDEILRELGAIKKEVEETGDRIDLTSELLIIGVTGTVQVIKLGSKRLKKLVLKKKSLQAAQKVLAASVSKDCSQSLVIDKSTEALVDNSVMALAGRTVQADKLRNSFVKSAGKSVTKKAAVYTVKAIVPVQYANGMGEMVSIVAEGLISGIDSIKPTNLAKAWIWANTMETPDDTERMAVEHVRRQTQNSLERLRKTIKRLQQEKATVYPSGNAQ